MPDYQLAFVSSLINHRRTVAWFLGAERAPQFFASIFIESQDSSALTGRQADEPISIQQRVPGKAPQRCFCLVFLLKIVRPQNLSRSRIETEHIAFGPYREDLSAADYWGCARAARITYGLRAVVFVFPNHGSIGFFQADNALGPGDDPALKRIRGIACSG